MNFEEAKEKAVKYLVLQLRTEKEVEQKLQRLKVEQEIIIEVLEYLKSIGYIDDSKYVDAYLRQCISIPKYSVYEIKMKLIQKGINKNLINEKIQEFDSKEYENSLIQKLKASKLKNMEELKKIAYLYRRGFKISRDFEE